MKYLVIPDIHLHHQVAESIINKIKPDQIVFLGDAFDNFGDTPEMVYDTARWFKDFIHRPNVTICCGNHDVMYWFKDHGNIRCGGYTDEKSKIINSIIKPEDWDKLKFFAYVGDWLLSHAGVHPYWIDPVKFLSGERITISKEALIKKLEHDSTDCVVQLNKGKSHWFSIAGFARSNSPFVGGLLWCDFNQEFEPIRGIHQIVGHTPSKNKVQWRVLKSNDNAIYAPEKVKPELNEETSFNVCLDSYPALKWYGILEGNELSIFETKDISLV